MRGAIVVLTAMSLLAATLLAPTVQAAEDPRDFSGVWQAFATAPTVSAAAAAGTFTNDGEVRLADFAARYPNMVEGDAYCMPAGMPSMMTSIAGNPIDITQTPTRLTLFAALNSQYRRIYIDDRDYPEERAPSATGYSIARWDANTLVVETRLLSELLTGRFPRTEETVVVERFSKMQRDQVTAPANPAIVTPAIDEEVLAVNLAVTDPTLYNKPQVFTVYYQHVDDNELRDSNCTSGLWEQALKDANP